MSSFCWCFLPAVSRSQVRVKYMKHVVRDEGDPCFSFCTSVVSFQVHHTVTALWGLSRQRQAKDHGKGKILKIHTLVERRGKRSTTDQDIKIHLAQDSQGGGSFT